MELLKILLAEDDELQQRLIKKVVETAGFVLEIVENGKQAIEKIKENNYDLVLIDIEMPVMNGYETVAYIRQNLGDKSNIPIIMVTVLDQIGEAAKCMFLGANTYLAKPFKAEQLLKEIETLVII